MAEKPRDPIAHGQSDRGINPSAPTQGSESSDQGNTPSSAFQGERKSAGRDLRSTTAARDAREMTFRCADVGRLTCNWEVKGRNPEEMLPAIERHGREQHNLELDEAGRQRILDAIHRRSAA